MRPPSRSANRTRGDRGSQTLEYAAFFPLLLLVVVIVFEAFAVFTALERMESAARAGARLASTEGTAAASYTATQSLPSWLQSRGAAVSVVATDGGYYGEVTATMPLVFRNSGMEFDLTRRVDMPGT